MDSAELYERFAGDLPLEEVSAMPLELIEECVEEFRREGWHDVGQSDSAIARAIHDYAEGESDGS